MEYRHLFKELKIGPMTLRNRICMPAMHMGYEDAGEMTDREIDFYAARAEGGVGLITIGGCSIDLPGGGAIMIALYDDMFLPGLTKLADAVHKHGAKLSAQLFHSGRYSYAFMFGIDPVAPSPIPSTLTRVMPKELTKEEIDGIVKAFGDATARCVKAGFDAVEVIGSAGYLINQFLSPLTNRRTDEYGGTFENRSRFAREVITEVKKNAGDGCAVLVRIAGNNFMGQHDSRDEVFEIAKLYETLGVDGLNVTGGWHESHVPQITGNLPPAGYAYLARDLKETLRIPIIASNRIGNPKLAEEVLRWGFADAVNLGRSLIADPEIPNKAKDGREKEIRPCICCNQECMDRLFNGMTTLCTVNPAAGFEAESGIGRAEALKKVAVVGGGPGGCEAARTAALRGHDVTLFEASGRIGGQLFDASRAPGKDMYRDLAKYHENELERLGVRVKRNTAPSADQLKAGGFDAVVVAAGSSQIKPPVKGADLPHVVMARDVLEGRNDWTEDVVIIGAGGVGLDTAHVIAERDTISGEMVKFLLVNDAEPVEKLRTLASKIRRRITIVDMLEKAGKDVGKSTKWVILQELNRLGVRFVLGAKVLEIKPGSIVVEKNGETITIPATTVVLAAGARPDNGLVAQCKGNFSAVIPVGDCVAPRNITEAIREGFEAGRKI
jgi:2,4-dienoyl-CoA reductase (NADPH2)